ncbi:hypothetical protein G6F21_009103 [Rhizopus arrhizus]|nr:hypothetical protein G6F21_009103 [Rhizopus arrhizus]KAG1108779.1 hypothetical protein G6F40_009128 [Rhizopus arrhizus]
MLSPLTDTFTPVLFLTSIFRKILEKCIASDIELESPPLDTAQGGFRRPRSTLDQALCLVETCSILRQHHRITPTLAFLDIKSAYDTVDRGHIWQTLQPSVSPPLLALLRNLFDEVNIEVLLSNATSYRFSPATGVLQGSILLLFLYSIYSNQPPALLLTQPIEEVPSTDTPAPQDLAILLQQCEDHSHRLGYRWNPLKCAILAPSSDTQAYSLYGTTIPRQGIFSYLGIPINPGGYLNTAQLIQDNVNKALQTMNQMTTIGVNNKGFDRLPSVRFYTQIVRSQLEYGLAVSSVPAHQLQKLDACQTQCIRRIFGGGSRSSIKVMLHLYLPYLCTSASRSQWYKLSKTTAWQRCTASHDPDELNSSTLKTIYKTYLEDNLDTRRSTSNSVLFSVCRPNLGLDPILWLPMTYAERSRVIRWRLGWLPGGIPQPCIYHPNIMLTRSHATECLHMHRRLQMPRTEVDPLSFLLNQLPNKRKELMSPNANSKNPAWTVRWPAICQILFELDYMHHGKLPPESPPLGTKLVAWICNN